MSNMAEDNVFDPLKSYLVKVPIPRRFRSQFNRPHTSFHGTRDGTTSSLQ